MTQLERVWNLIKDGHPALHLAMFCLLATFTGLKLFRMLRIRGWLPGGEVVLATVGRKWEEPYPKQGCWVSCSTKAGSEEWKLQLPEVLWRRVDVGKRLTLMRLPGYATPFVTPGQDATTGHVIFDSALLHLWLGGIVYSLGRLFT